jgi:hypothetical protein
MLHADIVFGAAIVAMALANVYFAPRIKASRIVMQWGIDGKPVWSGPRWLGLWGLIAFALMVRLLIALAMAYAPRGVHGADLGVMIMSVVIVISHLFVLIRAAA